MQNLGQKIYFALIVMAIAFLAWRVVNTKFVYHPPGTQVLALLPEQAMPVWEASDSASVAESQARLSREVSAKAYVVMDVSSRTIITAKNLDEPLPPASVTKLLTALAALEMYDLNETVRVSTAAAEEQSWGGLFPLEEIAVRDLLIGTIVSSANDSALALAEHAPGGQTQFLERMNVMARQLHLDQSLFQNAIGYDDPPNMMSVRDLAVLTLSAIKEPRLLEWMGLERAVVFNTAQTIRHVLPTTNELLGLDPRFIAGKTGTTEGAGQVLTSLVDHQGRLLLIVVMGSQDRYADTLLLLRWVTENTKNATISPWLPDQFNHPTPI